MPSFFNQASLSYNGRTTNSNITEGELVAAITAEKTAISDTYSPGSNIVYAITVTNTSAAAQQTTITDNLGAFTQDSGTVAIPLDYTEGSAVLYINGTPAAAPNVEALGDYLLFSGISIPAGGTALLLYEATPNGLAPLNIGGEIINTATVNLGNEAITVTAAVTAAQTQMLSIAKAICPTTLFEGDTVSYTFVIQNSGNTPIVATDDVVVNDSFNPPLSNITVENDGRIWTEGVHYTYNEASGEFSTYNGAIAVPAAAYSADGNGALTVTPGVTVITVRGTIG